MTWNQDGSNVFVRLLQTTSCPDSTPHFSTPLELQLHSATGDTGIKVYNSTDDQMFSFTWGQPVSTVFLNPDAMTICRLLGTVKQDTTLGLGNVLPHKIHVFPNPAKNYWQIEQLPDDTGLVLTDMNGHKGVANIPGSHLPAGNYLLTLNGSTFTESVTLTHW